MKNEIYQNCKAILKEVAATEKRHNKNDKTRVRTVLNDETDNLHRQIDFHAMKETISQKQAELYKNWLSNYCCKLHP